MKVIQKSLLIISPILLILGSFGLTGSWSPVLVILGLITLSVGIRINTFLRGFTYTVLILAAVVMSLYYPGYFVQIGGFELKGLIIPLLQVIMFGMGSQMSLNDFKGVIMAPKAVFIGILCQFTIMPVIAWCLISVFQFPAEIAAGIILVGASPSGLASNVMVFLARANVALSVTLTAVATVLAPILTPMLMKLLAGELIPVDFWSMMLGIMNMVIIPIVAGLIFNLFAFSEIKPKNRVFQIVCFSLVIFAKHAIALGTGNTLQNQGGIFIYDILGFIILPIVAGWLFLKLFGRNRMLMEKILSLVSMIAIGIIITVITAAGRDNLLEIGALLIVACIFHNTLGYGLGYWICRLFGMDRASCRTIAFEVGMQNSGMASGVALQMGKIATVGLAPSVFGPLMNVTGSSLATWWRSSKD